VISHHQKDLVISPTHACIVGLGVDETAYELGAWAHMDAAVQQFFQAQQTPLVAPTTVPAPAATRAHIEPTYEASSDEERQPIVEMKGVTIVYGDRKVFDQLQWTVCQGQNWVVWGGNGSGKSTLLELITGENMLAYQQPLYLFGKKKGSGESVWDLKRKMGVISTEFHMGYAAAMQEPENREVDTWDVICSGFFDSVGIYQSVSREQEDTARMWVDKFGLNDLVSPPARLRDRANKSGETVGKMRKFRHLSHGQQKLVLLCRAMVKSPKLLLLDEPTHGLSGHNRTRLFNMLTMLANDSSEVTLIYVTHRQEEIDTLKFDNILRL